MYAQPGFKVITVNELGLAVHAWLISGPETDLEVKSHIKSASEGVVHIYNRNVFDPFLYL